MHKEAPCLLRRKKLVFACSSYLLAVLCGSHPALGWLLFYNQYSFLWWLAYASREICDGLARLILDREKVQ